MVGYTETAGGMVTYHSVSSGCTWDQKEPYLQHQRTLERRKRLLDAYGGCVMSMNDERLGKKKLGVSDYISMSIFFFTRHHTSRDSNTTTTRTNTATQSAATITITDNHRMDNDGVHHTDHRPPPWRRTTTMTQRRPPMRSRS